MTTAFPDLDAYFQVPHDARPPAFFREDRFKPAPFYPPTFTAGIHKAAFPSLPAIPEMARATVLILVDVAWGGAALEGGSYTFADTEHLVKEGATKPGASTDDTHLVRTHLAAWRYLTMLERRPTLDEIRETHRLLATEPVPGANSAHFLPEGQAGVFRVDPPEGLWIQGSAYIPPGTYDRGLDFLPQSLEQLAQGIAALPEVADRALSWLARLPYLQPFSDSNKRLGRLLAAWEFHHVHAPIPRLGKMDRRKYLRGMLAFYELGDLRLLGKVFQGAIEAGLKADNAMWEAMNRILRQREIEDDLGYEM
jgi:hypothetical protein